MLAGHEAVQRDGHWWPLVSTPADYAHEAALYREILTTTTPSTPTRTVLELGSGGGNNASHLKHWFTLTLVDFSDGMLEGQPRAHPECEHHQGDMRTVRLGRTFGRRLHPRRHLLHDRRAPVARRHRHRGGAHAPGRRVPLGARRHARDLRALDRSRRPRRSGDGRGVRYPHVDPAKAAGATCHAVHFAFLLRESRRPRCARCTTSTPTGCFRAPLAHLLDECGFDATIKPLTHEDGQRTEAFVGIKR